jgi:hypothetical protein
MREQDGGVGASQKRESGSSVLPGRAVKFAKDPGVGNAGLLSGTPPGCLVLEFVVRLETRAIAERGGRDARRTAGESPVLRVFGVEDVDVQPDLKKF